MKKGKKKYEEIEGISRGTLRLYRFSHLSRVVNASRKRIEMALGSPVRDTFVVGWTPLRNLSRCFGDSFYRDKRERERDVSRRDS